MIPGASPGNRTVNMNGYWTYTCRCECCGNKIDYLVDKAKRLGAHIIYKDFRTITANLAKHPQFNRCDTCDKHTLQPVVAFDSPPDDEEPM